MQKKPWKILTRAGKILKENGLTFCYHAHGYEFQPYENGTLLDYIIKNTNPEYVSFEMDVFWIQFGGGDPVALLKKYGRSLETDASERSEKRSKERSYRTYRP